MHIALKSQLKTKRRTLEIYKNDFHALLTNRRAAEKDWNWLNNKVAKLEKEIAELEAQINYTEQIEEVTDIKAGN